MSAGMIFDNLLPGEEVGTIGTDRPNTGLSEFRNSQLRACAAGTGTNYSSISKDYNGTYSAQRQEMVESGPAYERMRNLFIEVQMRPIYERFVMLATQRLVRIPSNIDLATLYHVDMRGPGLPWIDPKKEVEADALMVNNGFASRHGIIRKRGGDPAMIDKQIEADEFIPTDSTVQPDIPTSEQDAVQAAADAAAGTPREPLAPPDRRKPENHRPDRARTHRSANITDTSTRLITLYWRRPTRHGSSTRDSGR